VRARLGYDPFFSWARETLIIELTGAGGGFDVTLQLIGEDNRRQGAREMAIRQSDCAAAVDALALTISLAIDPATIIGNTPAPGGPAAPSRPPETSTDQSSRSAASAPSALDAAADAPGVASHAGASAVGSRTDAGTGASHVDTSVIAADGSRTPGASHAEDGPPVQFQLGLGVQGALGRAPVAAFGGLVFGSLRWRTLALDVQAGADLPATGAADAMGPVRVQSWLLSGAIVPCFRVGPFFGCGVASGGLLTATSVGATHPSRDSGVWWALGPRAGVELPLSPRLSFRAWCELLWVPTPDWLDLNGERIFSFPSISGAIVFAVDWRFL
jgi:hypothetical protein